MKKQEIEFRALNAVDRAKRRLPLEDMFVELKADWVRPQKAARQLAGSANAARGEQILWVVGIDEKNGLLGASNQDLANWLPAVKAEFEGALAPDLTHNLVIPVDSSAIVALEFDTDRSPYLVKNPSFGTSGGGPVEFEIPWRDGNSTRSARHADLIKLLVPIQKVPSAEVLNAKIECMSRPGQNTLNWSFSADVYLVPQNGRTTYLPHHRCSGHFWDAYDGRYVPFSSVALETGTTAEIDRDNAQLCLRGPGKIRVTGDAQTPFRSTFAPDIPVRLTFGVVNADGRAVELEIALPQLSGITNPITWAT